MSRDKTIDRLRGFAMFWVIVVHVLYWGDFFTEGSVNLWKSFCLFEMPLFFFVTGAGNSFSKPDSYFRFVSKRFRRILIPYWVFAIICAVLSIVKYSFEREMGWFALKVVLFWLVPVNRQLSSIPYLTQALWFIPVYLFVVLVTPVLKQMKHSSFRIAYAFLLLSVFAVTSILKMGWFQHATFYTFWTYLGLFYQEIKQTVEQKCNRKFFWYIAAVGVAAIFVLCFAGQPLDMQLNKFPPNIMFLAFSFVMMALIMLVVPHLDGAFAWLEKCRLVGKILRLFSTRSLTIFLYQVFAFNLTVPLVNGVIPGEGILPAALKAVLCLATTIPACAGFAVLFGGTEKLGSKAFRTGK